MTGPKVVVYRDVGGTWRYRIVAANGEPMAPSEAYASKANAIRGANDLIENVSAEMAFDIEED